MARYVVDGGKARIILSALVTPADVLVARRSAPRRRAFPTVLPS
jgi:hypothetical protein